MWAGYLKIRSVHPAWNGYSALYRAGESEGDEEEEWPPTSVAGTSWLLNSHFPTQLWIKE